MKEIWKDCKGYPGYQISNLGRVWSVKRQRYLKGCYDKYGYIKVCLTAKNGKTKTERIHRLVALAFLDNPNNYPQVNHKDENKQNNCVDNLEWCDAKYNNNYGTRTKRISKPVYCVELDRVFDGASQAARELNIDNSDIGKCCKGKLKRAGGYIWEYYNGEYKSYY